MTKVLRRCGVAAAIAASAVVAAVSPSAAATAAPATAAPASAATAAPDTAGDADARPVRVALTMTEQGAERLVRARFRTAAGRPLTAVEADVGALTNDPDLRVRTTDLLADPAVPGSFIAKVRFPNDGDWVIVVRFTAPEVAGPGNVTGEPMSAVELFHERITGIGPARSGHDLAANPSMRSLLAQNPTFLQQYTPGGVMGGVTPGPLTAAHSDAPTFDAAHLASDAALAGTRSVDLSSLAIALAHGLSALAWAASTVVLGAVVRVRRFRDDADAVDAVRRWYGRTAGLGLVGLTVTGPLMARRNSPGLADPHTLADTGLGRVYVGVFAVKLVLTGVALAAAFVIDRRASAVRVERLALVDGTTFEVEVPVSAEQTIAALRTPATLAVFASAGIMICVTVLSQVHLALH